MSTERGARQGGTTRDKREHRAAGRRYDVARRGSGLDPEHLLHDLRHACAQWPVENGANPQEVLDLLGHSTIATTARYLKLKNNTGAGRRVAWSNPSRSALLAL